MDQKQDANSDASTRPYIPMYPFLVLSYQPLQGVARMYPCIKEVSNTRQGAHRFSLAHLTANSLTREDRETRQEGCFLGLWWGRWGQEGYRMEASSTVQVMVIETQLTIKSLVVFFLSLVLFVEEPWRMKLWLNVFVVVTEDDSMFSAKRKQMEISGTQKQSECWGRKTRCPHDPDFGSRFGISFQSTGMTAEVFNFMFIFMIHTKQIQDSLVALQEKVVWR